MHILNVEFEPLFLFASERKTSQNLDEIYLKNA